MGPGKARGLSRGVESTGAVDQQDQRHRPESEQDDQASQTAAAGPKRRQRKGGGEQRNWDQQVGVRLAGGSRRDARGCDDGWQAGD